MRQLALGTTFAMVLVGSAIADCEYQGRQYEHGSTLCAAGGWLQECTVADYWKAIGYCRASDAEDPLTYTPATEPEPGTTPPQSEPEKGG